MKNVILTLFSLLSFVVFSQENESLKEDKHELKLSLEISPRTEYLKGFGTLPVKNQKGAFRTDQRTRLKGTYSFNDELITHISFQDIRTWGQQHHSNMSGASSVFLQEGWFEYFLSKENNFSIKFGRQVISYDNDRIFGTLDWALQGRSHDAFLLKYENPDDFKLHYGIAYYNGSNNSDDIYLGFNTYKFMSFIWFNKKIDDLKISLLALDNGTEMLNADTSGASINHGFTAGTHIEYGGKNDMIKPYTYFYYQFGDITKNNSKVSQSTFNFALGSDINFTDNFGMGVNFEMLSGSKNGNMSSGSFNPLFGTNHKFNGFMDYFYVGNSKTTGYGLNDLWGRLKYSKEKLTSTLDIHYFTTNTNPYNSNVKLSKELGIEIDLQCTYNINKYTKIIGGYSQMFGSRTMQELTGGDKNEIANWAWVQFIINPDILFKK